MHPGGSGDQVSTIPSPDAMPMIVMRRSGPVTRCPRANRLVSGVLVPLVDEEREEVCRDHQRIADELHHEHVLLLGVGGRSVEASLPEGRLQWVSSTRAVTRAVTCACQRTLASHPQSFGAVRHPQEQYA